MLQCNRDVWQCIECGERMARSLKTKHLAAHDSSARCALCGDVVSLAEATKHPESCMMRLVPCGWCAEQVAWMQSQQHHIICGCTKDQCLRCRRLIYRMHQQQHISTNCAFPEPVVDAIAEDAPPPSFHRRDPKQPALEAPQPTTDATTTPHTPHITEELTTVTAKQESSDAMELPPSRFQFSTFASDSPAPPQPIDTKPTTTITAASASPSFSARPPRSTLPCETCGSVIPVAVFADHQHACAALAAARTAPRPFSRGAPLPALGTPRTPPSPARSDSAGAVRAARAEETMARAATSSTSSTSSVRRGRLDGTLPLAPLPPLSQGAVDALDGAVARRVQTRGLSQDALERIAQGQTSTGKESLFSPLSLTPRSGSGGASRASAGVPSRKLPTKPP